MSSHHATIRRRKLAKAYFHSLGMSDEEIELRLSSHVLATKSKVELQRIFATFTEALVRTASRKGPAVPVSARPKPSEGGIPQFDSIRGAHPFEGPSPEASTSNHPSPRRGEAREQSGDFTPQSHPTDPNSDDERPSKMESSSVHEGAIIRIPSSVTVELAPVPLQEHDIAEPAHSSRPRPVIIGSVESPPRRTLARKSGSTRVSWNEGLDSVLATPDGGVSREDLDMLDVEDDVNVYDSIASIGVKRETRHAPVSLDDDDGVSRMVNEYWISHEVGHGAFGTVYQAVRTTDNRPFAVKVVSSRPRLGSASAVPSTAVSTSVTPTSTEPEPLLRGIPRSVLREITIMRRFQNQHLLPLEAVLHDAERHSLFLIVPLMRGPLLQVSTRGKVTSETYNEEDARRLIFQIATGLRYLHERRVVHLDIKPANILINESGDAVISDFGTSQIRNPGDHSPAAAGSPAYLPPEALQENVETIADGAAADMWALGVTWYMMLYGEHPFACGAKDAAFVKQRILTEHLIFSDAVDVSPPCRELIAGLLDREVRTRLTSKRLRESPYMNGLLTPAARPARPLHGSVDDSSTQLPPPLLGGDAISSSRGPPALTQVKEDANLNDNFEGSVRFDEQSLLWSPTNQQMANAVIDVRPATDFRPSSRPLDQ